MIKMVLFDFGGVLTESGRKGFIAQTLGQLYDQDPTTMEIGDLHALFRRGQANDDVLFETLNRRYGKHVTKEMFLDVVHESFIPAAEVYKLAESLRNHGIKTGILSNIFNMNVTVLREEGWYKGFDPVILSCEEGYAKPDKEFYDIAVERSGVAPEEILFIDDQQKCMPPAEAMGMHTLIAVSPAQIVADTKKIIREINGVDL